MNKQMTAQHEEIRALHAKMDTPGVDKSATLDELTAKTIKFVNDWQLQQAEWSAEIKRLTDAAASRPAPERSTLQRVARAYAAWVVIVLAFIGVIAMIAR